MSAAVKAVALLSGGLDSALAVRVMQSQGIEMIGISCRHPFHHGPPAAGPGYPERVAAELGIELIRPDVTADFLAMLKAPAHGFGRNLNPCIDCRLLYLREGARLMKERGAQFLVTGEVLGQRPMSQRRDAMAAIDRDSGLSGLILRPLCARLLAPTIPEEKGWVKRESLLDISGRGRNPQLALAQAFGLTAFSAPAGGCLLTFADFARKMKDLLDHVESVTAADVALLKVGRHFRLGPELFLAVGKNEEENQRLLDYVRPDDLVLDSPEAPGPVGLLRGPAAAAEVKLACGILGRYIHKAEGPINFTVARGRAEPGERLSVVALSLPAVESYRI